MHGISENIHNSKVYLTFSGRENCSHADTRAVQTHKKFVDVFSPLFSSDFGILKNVWEDKGRKNASVSVVYLTAREI